MFVDCFDALTDSTAAGRSRNGSEKTDPVKIDIAAGLHDWVTPNIMRNASTAAEATNKRMEAAAGGSLGKTEEELGFIVLRRLSG